MIQCPKCGAMNPDDLRNCKECYHPFGLERALGEMRPATQPPPPGHNIAGVPPVVKDPVSGRPAQVLAVRPIRKVPVAVWAMLAVLLVAVIFAVAWFITHSSSGSGSYLKSVFSNMEGLAGWEADIRVDSSEYPVDAFYFYLGNSWKGTLVFQTPDRFALSASSLQSSDSYGMRIIEGTIYEWDSYSGVWRNMGPASEYQMGTNPIWDTAFIEELPVSEEEELREVEGIMCKVLAFDDTVKISEESLFSDYEITYHYQGEIFVDSVTDLLVAIDYIIEVPDLGRSHYRYVFHSLGSQTSVEVPPGACAPSLGGG
ncbi:MAG: hypothetical protein JW854_02400 [Actinobacteria bacterium]|nr:hypothetical protein [Actinomycetota bacterium]